jgi:hypothetical protein
MAEYRNVGDHVVDLADGRMLGPGEFADLSSEDAEDPHNQDMISSGVLLAVDEGQEKAEPSTKAKASTKKEGGE